MRAIGSLFYYLKKLTKCTILGSIGNTVRLRINVNLQTSLYQFF